MEQSRIGGRVKYFEPSLARTANGGFISAENLDNDEYCLKCHEDSYKQWEHSAHRFSSFNNPAYLVSIRETREVSMKLDGNMKGSRFCAVAMIPFHSLVVRLTIRITTMLRIRRRKPGLLARHAMPSPTLTPHEGTQTLSLKNRCTIPLRSAKILSAMDQQSVDQG